MIILLSVLSIREDMLGKKSFLFFSLKEIKIFKLILNTNDLIFPFLIKRLAQTIRIS